MNLKGEAKGYGAFTYDSMGKKLRFISNESFATNSSVDVDLLMLFDEVTDFFLLKRNHFSLDVVLHPEMYHSIYI